MDKSDGFARQADDAFHVGEVSAGQADADNIAAARFVKGVGKAVNHVDGAVPVGGGHADAGDANGQKDDTKNDGAKDHQDQNANESMAGAPADGDGL